jgi:hypothetical protein
VRLVLAGDSAGASAYLTAHGTRDYAGSPEAARQLAAVLAKVAPGPLIVVNHDALGNDYVGLPVARSAAEAPAIAIIVRVTATAPFQIRELGLARIDGAP